MGRFGALVYASMLSSLILSGCNYGDTVAVGGDTKANPDAPSENVVCNPFNSENPALQGHGLTAQLRYLSDDQPRYSTVMDNINFGHLVEATIYLNDVNVPTRPFDRGFFTQTGSVVVNSSGNQLYEYFSLDMQSQLALSATDAVGDYQMAILADDGAMIEVQDSADGYSLLVGDDGTHPTQMGCATRPIHMTDQTTLPIKVHYFQGPRFHISAVVMWRPWPANPLDVNDPLCGSSGNSLFFDSTQTPSTPQPAYNDLLARGWKPVAPTNYLLPFNTGANNPCAVASAPQVSFFSVSQVTQTTAVLTWNTDIPTNSQGAFSLSGTGSYNFTTIDNTPTTIHSVTLTGLTNFGSYSVYGLSSAAGFQTLTNTLNFRTLR